MRGEMENGYRELVLDGPSPGFGLDFGSIRLIILGLAGAWRLNDVRTDRMKRILIIVSSRSHHGTSHITHQIIVAIIHHCITVSFSRLQRTNEPSETKRHTTRMVMRLSLFVIECLILQVRVSHAFFTNRVARHGTVPIALASTQESQNDGIGVGIDLGTTNSAIAFLDGNVPKIIEIPNNGPTMKSVVSYDDDSIPLVGKDAIDWERDENISAYRHVKRVIGTGANFLSPETTDVVPHLVPVSPAGEKSSRTKNKKNKKKKQPSLVRLLEDAKENPTMLFSLKTNEGKVGNKVSPETISSSILQKLLDVASEHTKKPITRAVIGVPAYFNDAQRDATVRAANLAGIEKVKLLREPEAAALAYGVDKESTEEEELVLVFDLGGGTYDVSILLVEKGLTEIVCTSGNSQLGGSNFDAKIAKHLASLTSNCCRTEECSDTIVRAAESIRIYLSNNRVANLALPLTDSGWLDLGDAADVIITKEDSSTEVGANNATHAFYNFTRKEMEQVCIDELQQLMKPIREVAIMAGALLPGDARPSVVETALEMESAFTDAENFYDEDDLETPSDNQANQHVQEEIDFKTAKKLQQKGRKKARQVAKQEKKFRNESRKVIETAPDTKVRADGISGRPISRVVLVGGATRMPAIGRLIAALIGVVPQRTVDPDEAVALGCAVHVGVLDGNEAMGTVLNPMQAALLRAVVEKQRREGQLDDLLLEDEDEFGEYEIIEF